MFEDLFLVEPCWIEDRAFAFGDRDEIGALFTAEFCGVEADVAEPLHDEALPFDPGREAERLRVGRIAARLREGVHESASGGLAAAVDAAFRHRLAGDAGERLELSGVELSVRVCDPRHLALTGAVVGRRNVDAGADELLADELVRIA